MKNIYLDTEFSEGFFKPISWLPKWFPGNKPRWSIELISIGLVDDQGKEYYAINKDYKYSRCNKWVRENVLTKLPDRLLWVDKYFDHYAPNPVYKSIDEIREDIIDFVIDHCEISEIMGLSGGFEDAKKEWFKRNQVQFKAYYADYDWVLFCTIFGTMMDLPKGFPMYCLDLKQEFDRFAMTVQGQFMANLGSMSLDIIPLDQAVKRIKTNLVNEYPLQDTATEHGALADAAWNKRLDEWLEDNYSSVKKA